MKSSRLVSVAAGIFLALSTVTAGAGVPVTPPHSSSPAFPWIIFGCAGGVILAALDANWRQHRPLTPYEAATCGVAYWFTVTIPH